MMTPAMASAAVTVVPSAALTASPTSARAVVKAVRLMVPRMGFMLLFLCLLLLSPGASPQQPLKEAPEVPHGENAPGDRHSEAEKLSNVGLKP